MAIVCRADGCNLKLSNLPYLYFSPIIRLILDYDILECKILCICSTELCWARVVSIEEEELHVFNIWRFLSIPFREPEESRQAFKTSLVAQALLFISSRYESLDKTFVVEISYFEITSSCMI